MKDVLKRVKKILSPKIDRYRNYCADDLTQLLKVSSKAKNANSLIIAKMIDFSDIEYEDVLFLKAHTIFKTVNVGETGKVGQSMSFPTFDIYNMVKYDWQNSAVYNYFSKKIIVLFLFKTINGVKKFTGAQYLILSPEEMNEIFLVWEKTKNLIINDKLEIGGANGFSVMNFPGMADNPVTHIRPHDSSSSVGKVLLPNGKRIIRYSFWLNNSFIQQKIEEMEHE